MHIDEYTLSQAASLVQEHTGLRSPESNHSHLKRVLVKMCRTRGVSTSSILTYIRNDKDYLREFINEAMIGETYFFREVSQFRVLLKHVFAEISKKEGSIRIWSASCSTGEEAISLAAAAAHHCNNNAVGASVKVFASDINTLAVDRIRAGRYPKSSLRQDGKELHPLITDYIGEENETSFTLDKGILSSISIVPLNLYKDPLTEIPDGLDVIFFRNTLIYAPTDNRTIFIRKISEKLKIGGYLFVAASEVPYINIPQLEPVECEDVYLFRRVASQEARAVQEKSTAAAAATATTVATATAEKSPAASDKKDTSTLREDIQKIVTDFNAENMKSAELHLRDLENTYGDTVYVPFLKGLYFRGIGAKETATEKLSAALSFKNSFWPASYYLAELYIESDPLRACNEFKRCLQKIESQQQQETAEKEIEHILLDGFDKAYFHHLCTRWIKKLCTSEGEKYAH